jgi:hypothetical protein
VTDVNALGQFGAASASYGNATDFVDAQMFQGVSPGLVTLTPYVQANGSQYWVDASPGNPGFQQFVPRTFTSGDVLAAGGAGVMMRRRSRTGCTV